MKYMCFLAFLLFSIIWGRGVLFLKKHGISRKISMWLMRYVMKPLSNIEDVLLNTYYNGVGLIGIIVFTLILNIPIFKLFTISSYNLKYIIIAPLAVLSFANVIITLISPIFKSGKMTEAMMNVPWINFTSTVNPKIGPLIPCVGALLEEIFFRGVVFYYSYYICDFSFFLALLFSMLLFGIQQGVFTTSITQFLLMFCGAIIVTTISSTVMMLSGSIIPALLAHEIFIIFYFSKMGFEYKASTTNRGM